MDKKIINKNGVEVDMTKVERMMFRIIGVEKNNAKTKERNDHEMVNQLQKIIEEEAKCL